jgi:hypothetical protein
MNGHSLEDNLEALEQGIALLERMEDRIYATPVPQLSLSCVGGHLRHCLDFYVSFLRGLGAGRIDYDSRERDSRIELDRRYATDKIHAVCDGLRWLQKGTIPMEISVCLEGNGDAWSRSSPERELQFLLSHTIHHYALIAIALRFHGFDPGRGFGVAPSTLRYWDRQEAGSRRQRQEAGIGQEAGGSGRRQEKIDE